MKRFWTSMVAAGLLAVSAIAPAAAQDEVTYDLEPVDDSGISGNVRIAPEDDQVTVSVLITEGLEDDAVHPVHIHDGTCDDLGDVAYPLENIENGESETTVDVSAEELESGEYAINAHLSEDELDTSIACADLSEGEGTDGDAGDETGDEAAEDDGADEDDTTDDSDESDASDGDESTDDDGASEDDDAADDGAADEDEATDDEGASEDDGDDEESDDSAADDEEATGDDEDGASEDEDAAEDDEDDAADEEESTDEDESADDESAEESDDDSEDDADEIAPATGFADGIDPATGSMIMILMAGTVFGAGVVIRRFATHATKS